MKLIVFLLLSGWALLQETAPKDTPLKLRMDTLADGISQVPMEED
jgi:hypothetical protein